MPRTGEPKQKDLEKLAADEERSELQKLNVPDDVKEEILERLDCRGDDDFGRPDG